MDPNFIERLQCISLTAEEGEIITVHSDHREKTLEECSLSLIGRFLTSKTINLRAAKNLLRSVWKMGNDLKITEVGDGLLQFKFSLESQLQWVMNNGPWSFDNHLLLLQRWEVGMMAFSVTFHHAPFWVQVWGLPFDLITEQTGWDIGKAIGRVLDVDSKAIVSDQARFLRVRVELPLDKPIRRGAPVLSPEGNKVMVAFQYERLMGLCYNCGLLGHEAKGCNAGMGRQGDDSPYGEWLRAGSRRPKIYRTQQTSSPQQQNSTERANGQEPRERHAPETEIPVTDSVLSGMDVCVTDGQLELIANQEEQIFHSSDTAGLDNDHNDHNDSMMRTERNFEDPNPGNKGDLNGDSLISVPISYANSGSGKEENPRGSSEPTRDCNMPRDLQKTGKTKEKKWKRRARVAQPNTTEKEKIDGKGRRKKRVCTEEGENTNSGSTKRNKTMVTSSICTTAEAETQPRRAQ